MTPIVGQIKEIVENVTRGSASAERHCDKPRKKPAQRVGGVRSDKGKENNEVLHPLRGTQRTHELHEKRLRNAQCARVRAQRPQSARQTSRTTDRHGGACAAPDVEIGGRIADIVETAITESLDKLGRLGRTNEVDAAIGGKEPISTNVSSKRCNNERIGTRCKPDLAPGATCTVNLVDDRRPKGNIGGVTRGKPRHRALQRSHALEGLESELRKAQRAQGDGASKTLKQAVTADQRSVNINDKRDDIRTSTRRTTVTMHLIHNRIL